MYTPEALRAMSPKQLGDLFARLTRNDLEDLLVYVAVYSPEGTAEALKFSARTSRDFAARIAQPEPLAVA